MHVLCTLLSVYFEGRGRTNSGRHAQGHVVCFGKQPQTHWHMNIGDAETNGYVAFKKNLIPYLFCLCFVSVWLFSVGASKPCRLDVLVETVIV